MRAVIPSKARKWWKGDLYIASGSIVGRIEPIGNSVFAYGMMNEWDDHPLGAFSNRRGAKSAVTDWVKENDDAC